jgi:hypothetical protein
MFIAKTFKEELLHNRRMKKKLKDKQRLERRDARSLRDQSSSFDVVASES